jgi:hypothetical protein
MGDARSSQLRPCKTNWVSEPRFRVLEVVEISDPALTELVGKQGAVTQVREYGDGRFRYGLGGLDEDSAVGGLYDEAVLRATGQSASVDLFRVPGPFAERELVRVSAEAGIEAVTGLVGEIDGSYQDSTELALGVWFAELGEAFVIAPRYLESTGERRPAAEPGRTASSTRVDVSGEVVGGDEYKIVDEIGRYL